MDCFAFAADLAAGIPLAYFYQLLSPVFQFVLQHIQEHSIAIIQRGLPIFESSVAHCTHIQIFHTHYKISIGYLGTLFMKKIFSLVGCLTIYAGNSLLLFFIVSASNLFVFQLLLVFSQFLC